MPAEQISVTQPLVPLFFGASNIPDAAGNAFASEPASQAYVMPWAGSIVGMSVAQNAALSTGTLTWRPTIDGTANPALTTSTDSSNQRNTAKANVGKVPFAAGQRLGVDWTKSGTISATTTDAAIVLWVQLDEVRV